MATTNKNFRVKNGLDAGGDISADLNLRSLNSSGDEGGEIFLNKAVTNTTLNGGVTIDVWQNKLRFFEQGGTARGFYLDITTGGAGVGTNLVGSSGSGTVTSVSVVSANGFAGTVATASTTPAITLTTSVTGLLKGNGTAISAATAGTDYVVPSGSITGSAATLTTTRTLWGQNFNGSANVTGNLSSVGTITGTAGTTLAISVPSVATATGTDVTIAAGNSTYSAGAANAGDISITAGNATSGTSVSSGGNVTIAAGASNTTNGAGGNVYIDAGLGSVANGNGYVVIGANNTDGITLSSAVSAANISTTGGITSGTNVYASNVISLTGKAGTVTSQDSGYYFNPAGYGLFTRSGGFPFYVHRYGGTGTYGMVQFIYNGTNNGTINVASGGTPAFASGSDYRMKTDIAPITDAIQRMKSAKAYTFHKIAEIDPSDNLHTGFLAHELAEVQPDAVIGEKDAVDENGKPIYQEVMEAKIIPVMAQAINDLIGMVESLTARVEELENK